LYVIKIYYINSSGDETPIASGDEKQYEVEKILGQKWQGNSKLYLVSYFFSFLIFLYFKLKLIFFRSDGRDIPPHMIVGSPQKIYAVRKMLWKIF
jgi:hypothetical protein